MLLILLSLIIIALLLAILTILAAVLDRYRVVIKDAAMDTIQVYAAAGNARIDLQARENELEITTQSEQNKLQTQVTLGRLAIHRQRQMLISDSTINE